MSQPRVIGLVVARMGSTRVPGKSVLDLCGKPLLWHVIENAKLIKGIDQIVLATTDLELDAPLCAIAESCGVEVFRGHPEHVLDRVYGAAQKYKADVVVDIGGDCPLLPPTLVEEGLADFFATPCDYLCNYEPPTHPEGFDINILRFSAIERAFNEALAPSQRIHPFSYLTRHRDQFTIRNFASPDTRRDLSVLHWSVDFPEDVDFVRAVYEKLYTPGQAITMEAVLDLITRDETVRALDAKIQKPKALHAFWNSPGIIRDMHHDLKVLGEDSLTALRGGDRPLASRLYSEISWIVAELKRMADFSPEKS